MPSSMHIAAVAAAVAGSASAQIASFTYSDLNGSYDANTGTYTAVADAQTSGDVTRLTAAGGSAEFDAGFAMASTQADFNVELAISNVTGATADGLGSLMIADDNGDTLTAVLAGTFQVFGPWVSFQGLLSGIEFNDISGDGTFDGTSSGAFSTTFAASSPYEGSVVSLFFDAGVFFTNSFSGQRTLTSGLILPAPGSIALLGFAGLVGIRRPRH